jgi:hypothetical protein
MRITGAEPRDLKRLDMPESLGLNRRIERRYQGTRAIGLYRWDLSVPTTSGVPLSAPRQQIDGGDSVRGTELDNRVRPLCSNEVERNAAPRGDW